MTERMQGVLRVLRDAHYEYERGKSRTAAMTCNAIGLALGFDHGMHGSRYSHSGKRMGPANRVNFAVTRLENLGLVTYAARPDGLSGGAYRITDAGLEAIADA